MNRENQLRELYMESSKHSNYQILPTCLTDILHSDKLEIQSRWEKERFEYICNHLVLEGRKILDIGGNTGFFSFEAITAGADHVDYYEGNAVHAEFVGAASNILKLEKKLTVFSEYYLFDKNKSKYDITLCLNVLHHLGGDFETGYSMEVAKKRILYCINTLSTVTDVLILQLGFNWCGKKEHCMFEYGTKQEMEQYITEGTKNFWDIINIGIAENDKEGLRYVDLNENNNIRNDELGEFLNRPIFIMKAKR